MKGSADRRTKAGTRMKDAGKGREGVRPKKALGQHFLTDPAIARRIADALSAGTENEPAPVLEIGCGTGVLTRPLLERGDIALYGSEIDRESIAFLQAHLPQFACRLIEGDFLALDLAERFPGGVRIIGNFPYNISSQILFHIIRYRDFVPEAVGMFQREVALRIASSPGSRDYGILSVLLQAWYEVEYLFTVDEHVFSPPPKVKSAVVRLRRNGTGALECDEKLFVAVVKAAFGQRRKTLRNALRAVFGTMGGAEHPFFGRRAETLSVAEFVELTGWVAGHK